jgi:hypothetical protein
MSSSTARAAPALVARAAPRAVVCAAAVAWTAVAHAEQRPDRPAIPPALELPAGGLVFNGRDKISVAQEALTIALDRIEIDYRLRNTETRARTLVIAFAMPVIDMANLYGQSLAVPAFDPANPTNFVGFWTTVDGVAVEPDVDVRAFAVGQADATAELKRHGLPLYPLAPGLNDQIAALPLETRRDLDSANLIDADASPPQPLWALKTVFHWRQTMGAEATTSWRHHYRPVAGSAPWSDEVKAKWTAKYCLSADDVAALDKVAAEGRAPTVYWVHYAPGNNAWLKGETVAHVLSIERPVGLGIAATCAPGSRDSTDKGFKITSSNRTDDAEVYVLFAE